MTATGWELSMPAGGPAFAAHCRAARERVTGITCVTPLRRDPLTRLLLKCENLQLTGSFKIRGVTNTLAVLRPPVAIAGSSGNHGIALAWAARQFGVPATVVMADGASVYKRQLAERWGATVVTSPGGHVARASRVDELARAAGTTAVYSDAPLAVAGQASVGAEILEQSGDVRAIVVPVGAGGLIAGIAASVGASGRRVRVIGVEPMAANDTALSIAAGHRVSIAPPQSICDGVLAQSPGEFTFPIIQRLVDEILEVSEDEVVAAMRSLAACGMAVEPTGALAYAGARRLGRLRDVVAVVSGGNIAPAESRRLTSRRRERGGRQ
jgi:threonine dehydratase